MEEVNPFTKSVSGEFATTIVVGRQTNQYPARFCSVPVYEPTLIGDHRSGFRVEYKLAFVVPTGESGIEVRHPPPISTNQFRRLPVMIRERVDILERHIPEERRMRAGRNLGEAVGVGEIASETAGRERYTLFNFHGDFLDVYAATIVRGSASMFCNFRFKINWLYMFPQPYILSTNLIKKCMDNGHTGCALRRCSVAREAWSKAQIFSWERGFGLDESESWRFMLKVQELINQEVACWVIWTGQNQELLGMGRTEDSRSARFALNYVNQRLNASRMISSQPQDDDDCYKVNTDGALDVSRKIGCIGVIVLNSGGEVMGALAHPIEGVDDPLMAEALAVVKSLQFARDMGFTRVVVQGDFAGIVNRLKSGEDDLSAVGLAIKEGRALVGQFNWCTIIHKRRQCNSSAEHWLANYGMGLPQEAIWVKQAPPFNSDGPPL